MGDRTLGQKCEQWLTNLKLLIPLLSLLGLSSIYGNSDTVKDFIHGEPLVIKEVRLIDYGDRISKTEIRLSKIESELSNHIDKINELNGWH